MAHKATSFKLDEKKKTITLYTNVDAPAEKALVDFYLKQGYAPMLEEKKPTKTIEDMREELKDDAETLKAFNDAYATKGKGKDTGFFKACKIYSNWKKEQKAKGKKK